MTTIAPPREHLELSQRVRYTRRAAVARLPARTAGSGGLFALGEAESKPPRQWILTKEGGGYDAMMYIPPDHGPNLAHLPTDGSLNKAIVEWDESGEGFVFGLVRKGVGLSVAGYTSGYETPEYEPGYFEAKEWRWLYAVKTYLNGLDYILVPLDAVEAI